MSRRGAPRLQVVLSTGGTVGASFESKQLWSCLLLVGDGETGVWVLEGLAVDSLDVDSQTLSVIIDVKVFAMKTGALPLKIQVVLEEPCILLNVCDTTI